ncbi:glutathione S-transferase N-terminal domain-containing protein [Pseudobacteriovorax antillogorgiicola]|uniref:Glutathione S-transferase n=1 Tax=Pseudobacteriovorax antillogorgiicola TaxID=1513793 RepID=A0A1Y6BS55_9BACT|nr:glutathione S-transferase N-terminal domain-containing protein [Pseudobacteriovorax antillogorgiicola]TCS54574.1 glutathione S-transferase [Pseudobacteriovorax antillogorgiicola]SMF18021.1 Glutathione S-transferase [Pseudobacteriovorax antillogorgiicola]
MYSIYKSDLWPVQDKSKIQLYSLATPNGRKVSIALEELGLDYEAHKVNILDNTQFRDEFVEINPNSKIPTIIDPDGPGGEPIAIMESGAILIYLAEKTGKLLPDDPRLRNETLQWLFFQMASVGPMFGQFGHFYKYAGEKCDHPYPTERYTNEARRLLGVLEKRLTGRKFLMGDQYTIADIATFPWVGCLDWGYDAVDQLGLGEFKEVMRWHDACDSRDASQRGNKVCGFD